MPDLLTFIGSEVARDIEEWVNSQIGWDAPAALFAVEAADLPNDVEEAIRSGLVEPVRTVETEVAVEGELPVDSGTVAFALHHLGELQGDPFLALIGEHAAPDVLGVILVVEGWSHPGELTHDIETDDLPPEEPGVEWRFSHMLWRDGTSVVVSRRRDTDQVLSADGDSLLGRMPGAFRRYLGLDSKIRHDISALQAARLLWLDSAARFVFEDESPLLEDIRSAGLLDGHEDDLQTRIRLLFWTEPSNVITRMNSNVPPHVVDAMGTLLDQAPDTTAGYVQILDDLPRLGSSGPAPGSEDDRDAWDRTRLRALKKLDDVMGQADRYFSESGSRHMCGVPSFAIREELESTRRRVEWFDAGLWSTEEVDPYLPSAETVLRYMSERTDQDSFAVAVLLAATAWIDPKTIVDRFPAVLGKEDS